MSTVPLTSAAVPASRRLRGVLSTIVVVAIVAVWAVSLRPQFLGGPTAVVVVAGTSMQPSLRTGDLVFVHERPTYRVGDIVAYRVPEGQVGEGTVVIHRITGGSATAGFVMRGDNRSSDDKWRPRPADIMGRRWFDLPTSNRFLTIAWSPVGLAAFAAAFAFSLIAFGSRKPPAPR
jgi:signal peptidase I